MTGKLQVLFADDALVVINKPAGISVVFDPFRKSQAPLWHEAWGELGQVLVVHRLDRDTSGALLLARRQDVQAAMTRQFSRHQVRKVYQAVVCPIPAWDRMVAEQPLLENGDRKHRTIVDWHRGKKSRTFFRVVLRLKNGWGLVEALPETGRRHQIRAHLAHLGSPIVGDCLYGGIERAPRFLLHCRNLGFHHPNSGNWVEVEAPYFEDMAELLKEVVTGFGF